MRIRKSLPFALAAAVIAGVGYFMWQPGQTAAVTSAIQNFARQWTQPADPPAGFAKTHGRIEATRVMITTKLPGKVQEVLVREGDTVDAGQVVARMDTRSLKAQFRKAEAEVRKARDAKSTAEAVVAERESELEVATRNFLRRKELLPTGGASKEDFDVAQSKMQTAKAALAGSQVPGGRGRVCD